MSKTASKNNDNDNSELLHKFQKVTTGKNGNLIQKGIRLRLRLRRDKSAVAKTSSAGFHRLLGILCDIEGVFKDI